MDQSEREKRVKKFLGRAVVLLGLIIAAVFVLASGNLWLNENAMVFVGANLDADERLIVDGQISVPWVTTRVRTDDNVGILLLESRLSGTSNRTPWLIYFYGQGGRVADAGSLLRYELFRSAGLNVLAVEYRGYGASEKTQPTEAGVYADARAAWRYITETAGVPASRVVLYGYSLGGGVAVQLAAEMAPAGLITEGAFTSAPALARYHYPWLLTTALMRSRFENLEKARSLALPWLIIHGREDGKVPFTHAEALAGTTGGMRRLVPLGCGHEDALQVEYDRMERALREFVAELFGADSDG